MAIAVRRVSGPVFGASYFASAFSGKVGSRPRRFLGVGTTEHFDERRNRILESDHCVDVLADRKLLAEITVSPVAVTEAARSATREIAEPDVGQPDPGERVEQVQLLERRQIAFDGAMRQRPVLAPLHVDRDLAAVAPVGVEQRPVPERPDVGRRAGRVVADPDDFLVGRDRERYPGAVDVVLPQQVVGNDAPRGMDDRDDSLQGEPFVALDV